MPTRILIGVLLLAALGIFGTMGWSALQPAPVHHAAAAVPTAVRVIIGKDALHAGSLIRPDDLTARAFPPDAVIAGAIVDNDAARASLTGALLRVSLPSGGVLVSNDVVYPGDHGYLAAVLAPGTRAVGVGVDAVSGNAGLIWPGDHVDLILTQSLDDANTPAGKRMVAETVISAVRVIATDQDLVRGEMPATNGAAGRTITLEATPDQAERISIASRMGRLSLALCAVDGGNSATTVNAVPIWSGDVSPALALSAAPPKPDAAVRLYDGIDEQKEFHF